MKMKITYTFRYVAMLASVLLVTSCNNENNENNEELKRDNSSNYYEKIGELHNVYTAKVLSDFQKRTNTRSTIDEPVSLVNSISSILESEKNILEENQVNEKEIKQALDYSSSYMTDIIIIRSIKEENLKISDYLIRFSLSKHELNFINELDRVINDDNFTISQITELENEYIKTATEKEKNVICVASSIARKSIEYWGDNAYEWLTTLAPANATTRGWYNGRRFCKADIAGGVGGAVGGAICGGMAGGVGAIPGAGIGGIGGAVSTSVADLIWQTIDHFWPDMITTPKNKDSAKVEDLNIEKLDEYSMKIEFKDAKYGLVSGKELKEILTDKIEDLLK